MPRSARRAELENVRHSAASVRVIRDLAGLGALTCLSCCRVDLSSSRFDDASHDGIGQLVVCRIVDAPAGGFEVAQRFENGRDDHAAVGVERQELLRTYRRNEALVTVEERRHGVAGAFLGFGYDFAGDGIYALERVPIRPIYRAEIRANLAHALRLRPLSGAQSGVGFDEHPSCRDEELVVGIVEHNAVRRWRSPRGAGPVEVCTNNLVWGAGGVMPPSRDRILLKGPPRWSGISRSNTPTRLNR